MWFGCFYLFLFIGCNYMPSLIKPAQLEKFRKNPKQVIIFDASWHLPETNRDAKQEYVNQHVAGAQFLDLTSFHDERAGLPNMLIRDETLIAEKMSALGITNEHKIVLYDNSDLHTSCRALWMFQVFGHSPHQLFLLDGGFPAWLQFGGKVATGLPAVVPFQSYQVTFQAKLIRTMMQMKMNLHHPVEQVVDLRHPVRFAGGSEHRPGLRMGHIPRSYSFPYFTMFEANGRFKSLEKIREQLIGVGLDLETPIVTTCGSGITSAILNFVLDLLGNEYHSLYDGSWAEWGVSHLYPGEESLAERPVETCLEN